VNKPAAGWLIMAAWLLFVGGGFWWFEYRYWHRFTAQNVVFNGEVLRQLQQRLPVSLKTTVVHFNDYACPCSRYSAPHIQRLQEVFKDTRQMVLSPGHGLMQGLNIPATPSVAVWDEKGRLAYFGPYSSGAVCGSGQDFVSRVLHSLAEAKNPMWVNTLAVGCYCPWVSLGGGHARQKAGA